MALFGPPDVTKLEAREDVNGLIKALGYQKDAQIRAEAASALGRIGDVRTVGPLIGALRDPDRQVPGYAGRALVQIGAPAVESLIRALHERDAQSARVAVQALGLIRDPSAAQPLAHAFVVHTDEEVRSAVVKAWVRIGAPAVVPLIKLLMDDDTPDALYDAVVDALGQIGASAVGPLLAMLREDNRLVSARAVRVLSQIGAPAVEPLVAALRDESWGMRSAAAEALERLDWQPDQGACGAAYWVAHQEWDRCVACSVEAVEPLIAALVTGYPAVRGPAAQTLGRIGDARAVAPLIAALRGNSPGVRRAAAEALVKLYRSGSLDEMHKQQILSLRDTILAIGDPHYDQTDPNYCADKGDEYHTDRQASFVDFAL